MDFSAVPGSNDLAERARQTANTLYPAVCALLNDGNSHSPRQFDICLKQRLRSGNLGEAPPKQVRLNGAYLEQFKLEPAYFNDVLVHEMAHVAQNYDRPIIGRWLMYTPRPPSCWVEGIADYVCFKLGQTNSSLCPECSSTYPHYRNGYSCAGAFLLYIEQNYCPSVVPQLNAVLRQGRYTDAFFLEVTSKELPVLWSEFQQTPAFTPGAAQMLRLQQQLGFADGKPPRDIDQRLDEFLANQVDAQTQKIMRGAQVAGLKASDPQTRLALILYFTQPGGTAEACMVGLREKQQLPGFSKGEHGTLTGFLNPRNLNPTFPAAREFSATKAGDASTFHYIVARASLESGWKLQRAWRTGPDQAVLEEYSVP